MQDLFLVRHGQSEHHVMGLTGGWTNTPLTEYGRRQASLTGHRLRELIPSASFNLFTSDLLRAVETAQIMGSILEVIPTVEKALRDLSWGVATDMPLEEVHELELEKTEPLLDWVPFPEAESWRMLHQRITPFLNEINSCNFDSVLIVSHQNIIEECIFWWLEAPLKMRREIAVDVAPCSITHLRVNDWQKKTIALFNNTDHLLSISADD